MVRAARALFATQGYGATSINAIAKEAGVSPQTFYGAFGTKAGVLRALLDAADADAGAQELGAVLRDAASDPRRQIEAMAAFCARFYTRFGDIVEIARAAGDSEPDLAELWKEGEGRRRKAQQKLITSWTHHAVPLSEKPSVALDVLWSMLSADVFRMLVTECGWPVARYEKWIATSLVSLVLR
jgi:AcrR family transcriptional regulator